MARRRCWRRSLRAKTIVGTKCVRTLPLSRWQSSMPPAGGRRSSMSTTSRGCSSASSNAASASDVVWTLIPCPFRKSTSGRATPRPGAATKPSTSLGSDKVLLCVVLSSGSIDTRVRRHHTAGAGFPLRLVDERLVGGAPAREQLVQLVGDAVGGGQQERQRDALALRERRRRAKRAPAKEAEDGVDDAVGELVCLRQRHLGYGAARHR